MISDRWLTSLRVLWEKKYSTFHLQTGCCWEEKPMVRIKDFWDWSVDFSPLIIWLDLILLNVSLEYWRQGGTHKTNSCVNHRLLFQWIKLMINRYVICSPVLWSNPRTDWQGLSDLDTLVRSNPMKKGNLKWMEDKAEGTRWQCTGKNSGRMTWNECACLCESYFSGFTRQHSSFNNILCFNWYLFLTGRLT